MPYLWPLAAMQHLAGRAPSPAVRFPLLPWLQVIEQKDILHALLEDVALLHGAKRCVCATVQCSTSQRSACGHGLPIGFFQALLIT